MQLSADGIVTLAARTQVAADIANELLSQANASGGWGYTPSKASRLEPTAWALIALAAEPRLAPELHRSFLERCRRPSGLLNDQAAAPPNYSHNAIVALAMLDQPSLGPADRVQAILAALVATSGLRTPPSPAIRQDNMLEGWPWIEDTFSWVEPTAWCLLALKRVGDRGPTAAAHRIAEAEKLLIDRCCDAGGWNYGNSNVLGKTLFPYVSVTAIALLALQNRRDVPQVARSLAFLDRDATTERSGMALALALIASRVHGRPTDDLERALVAQWQRTRFLGNTQTLAMARCALDTSPDALRAFGV